MKIFLPILILAVANVFASAISIAAQTVRSSDITEIFLEDEHSFGFERETRITLRRDGTAAYHGGRNAPAQTGDYQGAIDKNSFEALAKLLVKNGFFALQDRYEGSVSDIGTVTITVVYKGGQKSVVNWGGSDLREFATVKNAVNTVAAKIKWRKNGKQKIPASANNNNRKIQARHLQNDSAVYQIKKSAANFRG